jgi:twitching motility protein PilI
MSFLAPLSVTLPLRTRVEGVNRAVTMDPQSHPIALLREFDERYRALSRGLPGGAVEPGTTWRGIGFRLAGHDLVASMEQVREVLTDPIASRVPGSKNWVRGLANVRGRLVTVVDLAEFLQSPREARVRGQRALFAERGDLQVALLVDDVYGAKQLREDTRTEDVGAVPGVLRPYVTNRFVSATEQWSLFDVGRILSDPQFLNAAA